MNRVAPLALVFAVLVGVGMAGAALAAGEDLDGSPVVQQAEESGTDEFDYDQVGQQLADVAAVQPNADAQSADTQLSQEAREAAEAGAREGAEQAQLQGVDVTQAQEEAAVESAVQAASQFQEASVEQIQSAARGAAHGGLLQSQEANVTQLQAGVYGGAAGSLSQFQEANVTQIQSAAYGAAHGSVAQHQSANVTQLQHAAVGASAGATHGASQFQEANVTQIQESAQGSAYGSLTQIQEVRVEQIQAAAFGAAGGGSEHKSHDPKKVQEASMGAAQGSLVQSQEATVSQVQSAARGACAGALEQSQEVTVKQIQEASSGAAQGAISQHQEANVQQIQAAANGGARGTLTQVQTVEIVQVQTAALGSARGAARSAAQHQVVNVEQIQAAAAGAGQGALVQIQQINIVQIQVITESAAAGALSQHQEASVTQIQSAAQGASQGTISLSQRQAVTIEQIQTRTESAAATTVQTAIEINVEQSITIVNYARGAAEDPDPPADDPDEPDELRSLFVSVEDDSLFLANPNGEAVTVTISSEGEQFRTVTLSAGESITESLPPGTYTVTAETGDGRDVEVSGRTTLSFSVGDELRSLSATVDERTLTVENPNDQPATVTAHSTDGPTQTLAVPANWENDIRLDPGTYTLTAQVEDGRSVGINGQDSLEITIEDPTVRLEASVSDGTLTVENPSDTEVTVTATDDAGEATEFSVPAGATESRDLEPGEYSVAADADGRETLINNQASFDVEIEGDDEPGPEQPVDLTVTVENETVTIDNPGDVAVTVTATAADDREEQFDVDAGASASEEFDPGSWTLTGAAADDRNVTLEGQDAFTVEIEEPEPIDVNVTVGTETVTVENTGDADVTVTATAEDGTERTFDVSAGETVSESVEPGTWTFTGETETDRQVTVNGQDEFTGDVEPAPPGVLDLNVTADNETVTVENSDETDGATVTATAGDEREETIPVGPGETATEEFDPGTWTLTGDTDADRNVTLNGQDEFTVEVEEQLADVDLNVTVENETVTVENPIDVGVTVNASAEDGRSDQFAAPGGDTVSEEFEPGNWTLTATAEDDRNVTLNEQPAFTFEVEEEPEPPVDLTATVADGNLSVENPTDVDATVTATPDDGAESTTFTALAGETTTEPLEPGNYTLTGTTEADRNVTFDGQQETSIVIEEELDAIDLNVTVDNETVAIENPDETDAATLDATADDGRERSEDAGPGENVTAEFEPGTWTVTGTTDADREVTVNGQEEDTIEVEETLTTIDLNVTAENGTLTVENTGDAPVDVNATHADGDEERITVSGGETASPELQPGTWTVSAESVSGAPVTVNGQDEATVDVEEPPIEPIETNVTVADGAVTIENEGEAPVDVTATSAAGDETVVTVSGLDSATANLDPGTWTLTAESVSGDPVTLNDQETLEVEIEEPELDTSLEECTEITESGLYELSTDLQYADEAACLRVTASDVVIEGDGNEILGPGADAVPDQETVGVRIASTAEGPVENVSVRDVQVDGWNLGISLEQFEPETVGDVAVTDTNVSATERGVAVSGTEVELTNVTVEESIETGVSVADASEVTIAESRILRNGMGLDVTDTQAVELRSSEVEDNDMAGISLGAGTASASLVGTEVAGNGMEGVVIEQSAATLADVTLQNNGGVELDARGGSATATNLGVGPTATLDLTDQSLALDDVGQASLPALPEGASAVGDGLNVTGLEGTATLQLDYEPAPTDGEVALWRHDGVEWMPAQAQGTQGQLEAAIENDGIYAPVTPPADEDPEANVTVGNSAVWVENPTDDSLAVSIEGDAGTGVSGSVAPGDNQSFDGLGPGQYTLTATTPAGEAALIDGNPQLQFSLPPDLSSLSLSAVADEVTVSNPNGVPVDLIVERDTGEVTSVSIGPGGSAALTTAEYGPGTYQLSAETGDGRSVPVAGEWTTGVTLEETTEPTDETDQEGPTDDDTQQPDDGGADEPTDNETAQPPTDGEDGDPIDEGSQAPANETEQ